MASICVISCSYIYHHKIKTMSNGVKLFFIALLFVAFGAVTAVISDNATDTTNGLRWEAVSTASLVLGFVLFVIAYIMNKPRA